MLDLPQVTLVCIDTVDPQRSLKAMQYTLLQARFARAVLATNRGADVRTIGGRGRIDQIEVVSIQGGPREVYERQIICDLPNLFSTTHCLFQEWDSAIVNPNAWRKEWLNYDFIGAPWPHYFHEPGFPACTEANCVGNGGFSLRTHRFCKRTRDVTLAHPELWMASPKLSDAFISRTIRQELEARQVKFAPESDALKFSCENRFYNGQFGIHGKNTIAMNGWKWDFEWLR